MPAKSEKQKRFMKAVLDFKIGSEPSKKTSQQVKDAAKSMTLKQVKDFVNSPIEKETVNKLNEVNIEKFESTINKSNNFESFMQNLVGKKLNDLFNIDSYARLYVGNQYGIGGTYNEEDPKVILSDFLTNLTNYINFRKVDPLSKQLDDKSNESSDEIKKTSEYKDWLDKSEKLKQSYFSEKDPNKKRLIRKDLISHRSNNPVEKFYMDNSKTLHDIVKNFHNSPLTVDDITPSPNDSDSDKTAYKKAKKSFEQLKKLKYINEAESTISTIKKVKDKTFTELIDENNGVPFDEKELISLQTKQKGFGGIGRTKFTLNTNTNEIKAELFTNGKNKRCVIKKLIDEDAKNLYNYALFVEIVDENNKSENMFYMLSSNFNNENSLKIKTLTDFIDRFNSYGI